MTHAPTPALLARALVILTAALASLASSGAGSSLDEAAPGEDTYLEPEHYEPQPDGRSAALGRIAVDPDTGTSYVVQAVTEGSDAAASKELLAVPARAPTAAARLDVSGASDLRLVQGADELVVLREQAGRDTLVYVDKETLEVHDVIDTEARYHGTRLSPSRRTLLVGDNNVPGLPIHVIDLATRETTVIQEGDDEGVFEAMWLHREDVFVSVAFDADGATVRLRSVEALDAPLYEARIEGARPALLFSYSWIGVAPDDARIAIPVWRDGDYALALLDRARGDISLVQGVAGPVAFTPDGSTVVGHRVAEVADGEEPSSGELVLVDVEDLTTARIAVPDIAWPEYFVSRTGNTVVVAESWGGSLAIVDLDARTSTTLPTRELALTSFVVRDDASEMWIADRGLFLVDMLEASVAEVDVGADPTVINRLPSGELVMDNGDGDGLLFVDADTREVVAGSTLPLAPVPFP